MSNNSFDWSIWDWRARCGNKSTAPNTTNKQNTAIINMIDHNSADRFVEQHWAIFVMAWRFYTIREHAKAKGKTSTEINKVLFFSLSDRVRHVPHTVDS